MKNFLFFNPKRKELQISFATAIKLVQNNFSLRFYFQCNIYGDENDFALLLILTLFNHNNRFN